MLRYALAGTAMAILLVTLAHHQPPMAIAAVSAPEANRFDAAWFDLIEIHKTDREPLPLPPKRPIWPDIAPDPTPVIARIEPSAPPRVDSCSRRHMHKVKYQHRWYCKK